jgi:hypothetical protein
LFDASVSGWRTVPVVVSAPIAEVAAFGARLEVDAVLQTIVAYWGARSLLTNFVWPSSAIVRSGVGAFHDTTRVV